MKQYNMEQWSATEDAAITDGIREFSTRWGLIKIHKLPHRSVSSIRNRHQRMVKGTKGPPGRNRCQRCGQMKRGHTCILVRGMTDRVAVKGDDFYDDAYSRSTSSDAKCEKNAQPVCEPAPLPIPLDIPTFTLGKRGRDQTLAPMCSYIFEYTPRFIMETGAAEELGAFIEIPMISLTSV